jgi:tetratricopeptide (TPR) repeat protein
VGKSQVAMEYAYRSRDASRYQITGWVRADSPVTITEDLAVLAPLVGVSTEGKVGEIAAQVVGVLGTRRDWLMVFDNARRPDDLAGMLPGGAGHVLITSRNRVWSGIATQVDLDEFSVAESVEFLGERSGCEEPEAAAVLAKELGNLPLALAQAAAFIDARSMTIHGYLELYGDPILARRLRDAGLDSAEYPASVARTWLLSFMQLSDEHPAAVELLQLCAFLDPDDIDLDLLSAGRAEVGEVLAGVLGDKLERTEAAGALAAASLVAVPAEDHLRVHRLVQAVTRDQLDDDQAAQWAKKALHMAEAILPAEPADYRSWPTYARLAPHIEAIIGHVISYPILADKGLLLRNLAVYYSESKQLGAAHSMFQRVLVIDDAVYGPEHARVAMDLDNLAAVQIRMGEFGKARASIERALALIEGAYGPAHPDVARAFGNLGHAQLRLGELRDARASFERSLAIFEEAYGPEHPDFAKALRDLAEFQLRLRELRDARANIERALAIKDAVYGPEHPEVAGSLAILAAVQLRQLRLKDAIVNNKRALDIYIKAYGPDIDRVKLLMSPMYSQRGKIANFFMSLALKASAMDTSVKSAARSSPKH